MLVDIHTHIKLQSANRMILNLDFTEAQVLLSSNEKGWFSLGFHPWYADGFSNEAFVELAHWATDKRLVAIGECGLDKNSKIPMDEQIPVFEQQILLSERIKKPLMIHCVGCFNELFAIKKRIHPNQLWIIHGFRGKLELACQTLKAGCALSFGVHFNPESVRITPINSLFVETGDSTVPIQDIYRQLSVIKQCEAEDLNAGDILFQSFAEQFIV